MIHNPNALLFNDALVDEILGFEESQTFEVKRAGDNTKKIISVVALSNTDGGLLAIGIEDSQKAKGRSRVYGIQENPESVDELKRLLRNRVTPTLDQPTTNFPAFIEIGCTLRDGSKGAIILVKVDKSNAIHSVIDGGTYVRMGKSNRQISAPEITELSMQRGSSSAVNGLVNVPFELLDTIYWREYRDQRKLTRPIAEALSHLGLARKDSNDKFLPTRAAVLLFAEEPSGLLDTKCAIRLFHYQGDVIEHKANTNLLRPPKTVTGPLKIQIMQARDAVLDTLASGVQVGPLGFEIAQKYPIRVITEAITNAVIHRDYRISADIHIRVFANRIEVESPGVFPGNVTTYNIGKGGSHPRNRAIVDHLREFSSPPNLDAGEGVRMMIQTMAQSSLYPPLFVTRPYLEKEAVIVILFNELRPSTWDQVHAFLMKHGEIGNAEVRKLLHTDDPVKASRLIKSWADLGLLVVGNPDAAKQHRRYRLPGISPDQGLFSELLGKQMKDS